MYFLNTYHPGSLLTTRNTLTTQNTLTTLITLTTLTTPTTLPPRPLWPPRPTWLLDHPDQLDQLDHTTDTPPFNHSDHPDHIVRGHDTLHMIVGNNILQNLQKIKFSGTTLSQKRCLEHHLAVAWSNPWKCDGLMSLVLGTSVRAVRSSEGQGRPRTRPRKSGHAGNQRRDQGCWRPRDKRKAGVVAVLDSARTRTRWRQGSLLLTVDEILEGDYPFSLPCFSPNR